MNDQIIPQGIDPYTLVVVFKGILEDIIASLAFYDLKLVIDQYGRYTMKKVKI